MVLVGGVEREVPRSFRVRLGEDPLHAPLVPALREAERVEDIVNLDAPDVPVLAVAQLRDRRRALVKKTKKL